MRQGAREAFCRGGDLGEEEGSGDWSPLVPRALGLRGRRPRAEWGAGPRDNCGGGVPFWLPSICVLCVWKNGPSGPPAGEALQSGDTLDMGLSTTAGDPGAPNTVFPPAHPRPVSPLLRETGGRPLDRQGSGPGAAGRRTQTPRPDVRGPGQTPRAVGRNGEDGREAATGKHTF